MALPESLSELDKAEIDRTWTPETLAERMCEALDRADDDTLSRVLEALDAGGSDLFQSSVIADSADVSSQTPYAAIAAKGGHDPHSGDFERDVNEIERDVCDSEMKRQLLVTELARGLNGHMGEADAVADDRMAEWDVAGVEYEGDAVDLLGPERPELGRRWTAQVFTSESEQDGKTAVTKMGNKRDKVRGDDDHPGVDAYIVLHGFKDEEKYGVGVNDLTEEVDGDLLGSPWAASAANKAFKATDREK